MRRILIVGAGRSSSALVRYLLEKSYKEKLKIVIADISIENAKKLVEILPKIPREKIILETDGPYLTPHPYRGQRNEPKYTKNVAIKIAELLNISTEEVEKLTTDNTKKLFKEFDIQI